MSLMRSLWILLLKVKVQINIYDDSYSLLIQTPAISLHISQMGLCPDPGPLESMGCILRFCYVKDTQCHNDTFL